MSSFMVSNKTLNILASYIYQEQPKEVTYAFHYERDDPEKIYEKLRDLNHQALCMRYGEKAQEMWNVEEYEFNEIPEIVTWLGREEILCRLECFLCQCDEGYLFEEETYEALENLAGSMARAEVLQVYDSKIVENGWWG